jgi:hypothetical protein
MRDCLFRKGLVLTILLLLIGGTVVPSISGNIQKTGDSEDVEDNGFFPMYTDLTLKIYFTYSYEFINITIISPENGIYCSNHKIFPFFVPLILCGDTPSFEISLEGSNISEIDRVEFYIDNVLKETLHNGPWWPVISWEKPFSKIKIKVITYVVDDEQGSDEILIYRIFS